MVHFAQCTKEVTTEEHAQLFMDSVFRHHTMQEAIILIEIRGSSEEFGLLQWSFWGHASDVERHFTLRLTARVRSPSD